MSALHTPGPWEWTEDVDGWGHEGLSPDVIRPTVNERIRVDDANARLIAAAPDMLEALREAVEALDYSEMEIKELENTLSDYRQNWTPAKHAAFTCRSAIAKAT